MHGLKNAILSIFQEPVDFSSQFISLNMKPLSEVMPRLLIIQIQIQAVWRE